MNNKDEILKYFSDSEGLISTLNSFFKELDRRNLTKISSIDISEKHGSITIRFKVNEKEKEIIVDKIVKKYQNILNVQCFKCGKLNGREDYLCNECMEKFREENAYKDINSEGFSYIEEHYNRIRKFTKWTELEKIELIKQDAFGRIIEEIKFKLLEKKSIEIPNDLPIETDIIYCSYLTRNFYTLLKSIPKKLLSATDIVDIEKTFKNLENEFDKWRLEN
ncbi:hypothetical protein [Flavobacterium sp. CF136]|uniref:hypothetical protein n=1 Tax=Flavobacterium sp. (strain CF136) TaxID=1144313 RepID=UPI000271D263|nr:hypothetical protein [Flavobacterium sp. CF136]EJL62139.1 hypothetical protein PMI10_03037 [Flavobacterium sp. CF136]